MQCKKCDIEIPAQFEYALAKNVCPKCGNKLMQDAAMKVYIDLKTRLHEVEFVMDKATVCERVAMFLITNYEVVPFKLGKTSAVPSPVLASEKAQENAADIAKFKAELAAIANSDDSNLSAEEIRAEEAARAEELAIAREMGMDVEGLADGEEAVSGKVDNDRVQRLKKLAASTQIAKTGQVGLIKRTTP
jgi:hypothetical protein